MSFTHPPGINAATGFRTPEDKLSEALKHCHTVSFQSDSPFTGLIRRCYEQAPMSLSYLHHPEYAFGSWKEKTLAVLREALIGPSSLRAPADAQVLAVEQHDDFVIEDIEFTVTPPLRAKATVVIPRNGRSRHPAIVALHCMGGDRTFGKEKLMSRQGEPAYFSDYRSAYYESRSMQEELAREGFLSIAIDAFGFGERIWNPDHTEEAKPCANEADRMRYSEKAGIFLESLATRMLGAVGLSIAAVIATDDLRTVDYLLTRSDIDPSRIGCLGLSFGGFRSQYLAALDPRISAAASVCWTSTMRGIIDYNILGAMGYFALPPGLYRELDLTDIAATIAPKPYLAISGIHDLMLQPFGIAEAHLHMRKVWEDANASDHLGSLVYDDTHRFGKPMQEAAIQFFQHHLSR